MTAADRKRAKQSVSVQLNWAHQKRRQDLDDDEWDALRAEVKNPNLDAFKLHLAASERASTPEGRCEKALCRWLEHKGTWAGSTSYCSKTNYSWLWYVRHLLPRYYAQTEVWRTSKDSYHKHRAVLWSSNGTRLLKTKAVQKRKKIYGLSSYCASAAATTKVVLEKLSGFYNPEDDGEFNCKPTVALAASIVLGHVKRGVTGLKFCIIGHLLQSIQDSAPPPEKSDVFSRALEMFGSSGPSSCHAFAHKYDIVHATFVGEEAHPTAAVTLGMKQAVFTLTDPNNVSLSTTARLCDRKELPINLQQGDRLRLQVASSSLRNVMLEIPTDIGFLSAPDDTRPVAIIAIDVLGFVHTKTHKFIPRPHAIEFILEISRVYRLSIASNRRGASLTSRLFGVFDLLFVAEEDDLEDYISINHLDDTNSFILDSDNSVRPQSCSLQRIVIPSYVKKNIRDHELDISYTTCVFLKSIHDKTNIGIHIYNKYK